MTARDKLLRKLADRRSDKNWSVAELAGVLTSHGYQLRAIAGSHHVYTHRQLGATISIPAHGRAVKPIYVKNVRNAIIP